MSLMFVSEDEKLIENLSKAMYTYWDEEDTEGLKVYGEGRGEIYNGDRYILIGSGKDLRVIDLVKRETLQELYGESLPTEVVYHSAQKSVSPEDASRLNRILDNIEDKVLKKLPKGAKGSFIRFKYADGGKRILKYVAEI